MSQKIKDEEKLAFPKPSELFVPARFERAEAVRILMHCIVICMESNEDLARTLEERDRDQLKRALSKAPYPELVKRIEAISAQNPGCLMEAMKRAGYGISVDRDGNVTILPEGDNQFGAAGTPITEEEWKRNWEGLV